LHFCPKGFQNHVFSLFLFFFILLLFFILVQISYKITDWSEFLHNCKKVLRSNSSPGATQAYQSRWRISIGSEATWQLINSEQCQKSQLSAIQYNPHHHKQNWISLSKAVRSKLQPTQKIRKNSRTLTNPNRFLQAVQGESMEFVWTLRDSSTNLHHWVIFPAIQASNSSPEATNPKRDHRVRSWEEEGKKFRRIRTSQEKEEAFTDSIPDSSQKPTNRTGLKEFWKISAQIFS